MTVHICSKCLFCFERTGTPDACPDCAGINVRHASPAEVEQYRRNRAELDCVDEPGTPKTVGEAP